MRELVHPFEPEARRCELVEGVAGPAGVQELPVTAKLIGVDLGVSDQPDRHTARQRSDDLGAQTHQAMAHIRTILNELGADYGDVCKVLAMYQGNCGADALNANLPIRASYFNEPGAATTGVPLPKLAYESMNIEIDIYAMAEVES